mgnify:CR=1 FL=1
MAEYNLNEVLKAREAAQEGEKDQELHLDDVSRVKVLSPGRQVFKRFIRNRLAVFGSCLLIFMFLFSFVGPLFYAYGQKQIFYKYDVQNVNYAMAKENTAYNGYDVDDSVPVERPVVNAMNSNIKKLLADGEESMVVFGDEGVYEIRRLEEDIYSLSALEAEPVATTGSGTVKIGSFNKITGEIDYAGGEVEGLAEAADAAVSGKGGAFEYEGVNYTYERGAAKSYDIYAEMEGVMYTGEAMDEAFEKDLAAAIEAGDSSFVFAGETYELVRSKDIVQVYRLGDAATARIYTRLTVDTYETGGRVGDDFRAAALMALSGDGSFNLDGVDYTIAEEQGVPVIRTADGAEFAELTDFSVRRYTGEDTVEYRLKKVLAETVREMKDDGVKTSSLVYELPQQGESGEYVYDENGDLLYQETEMTITQRDTGEYVINCDQVNFVIDIFGAPSARHILGTDGDGFDVLARIMYGGRVSLMVGFVVVFLEILLGVIMGGLAGYYGGWVDNVIMRLVDIFYCLPSLPIMIILGAMMDALRMNTYIRLIIMMAALGIMGWAGVARLVRGQILSLREQEFMVAAEATGIKVKDRIFRHLVPNVMPQLIVYATMGIGGVIITESTLSFLGLGVKHPLATWGTIINSVSSASAMAHYAFIWIPVGLLICLTVIAFNFVGDGLRDAYDPKAKR